MLGVIQIRPVQRLALALVDRPRVAVPEPREVVAGLAHLAPFPALATGRVQPRRRHKLSFQCSN